MGLIGTIVLGQYLLLLAAPGIEQALGNESLFASGASSTTKNAAVLFAHFLVGVFAADVYLSQPATAAGRFNRYDMTAIMAIVMLATYLMVGRRLPSLSYMNYQWPTFYRFWLQCCWFVCHTAVSLGVIWKAGLSARRRLFRTASIYGIHRFFVA